MTTDIKDAIRDGLMSRNAARRYLDAGKTQMKHPVTIIPKDWEAQQWRCPVQIGFIFWLLMIIWLIFGMYLGFATTAGIVVLGGNALSFALFFLLGWKVFGFIVKE